MLIVCKSQCVASFSAILWRAEGLIILLMEKDEEPNKEEKFFDIVYNARSSRASRSRKSSVHLLEKDKPITKFKKLRKMTLNPESIRYQQIKEIEQKEHKGPASYRGEIKEEEFNIDDFLELGEPRIVTKEEENEEEIIEEFPKLESKGSIRFMELAGELQGLQLG